MLKSSGWIALISTLCASSVSAALPGCPNDKDAFWNNCFGSFVFRNGDTYSGDWVNNTFHGQGVLTRKNGESYSGTFRAGIREGQGVATFKDGRAAEKGLWSNDQFVGLGSVSRTPSPSKGAAPTQEVDMTEIGKKCEALGLKPKTEKFGECVLKLSRGQ